MPTRFYLDTSAHIERHGGHSTTRSVIRRHLEGAEHATSSHVQREWKSIVHRSAVDIINACKASTTVSDAEAMLRQGYGRKPGQHWLTLSMICADSRDLDDIQLRAEQYLRSRADVLFELDIDEVRNGSDCMLAKEQASQDRRTGRWSIKTQCRRADCVCDQVAFTDGQASRIEAAAAALVASKTSGHPKMAKNVRAAMSHPDKTYRKGRNCWGGSGLGGDVSIALECGNDETLLTTDQSFDEICPAVGVPHIRLTGTPTP